MDLIRFSCIAMTGLLVLTGACFGQDATSSTAAVSKTTTAKVTPVADSNKTGTSNDKPLPTSTKNPDTATTKNPQGTLTPYTASKENSTSQKPATDPQKNSTLTKSPNVLTTKQSNQSPVVTTTPSNSVQTTKTGATHKSDKATTSKTTITKPNSTEHVTVSSITTQKPDNKSSSTPKTDSSTKVPSSTESKDNITANNNPTQKPSGTTASTQKLDNTSVTTQKPSEKPASTQNPNNISATTKKSSGTPASTLKPNDTAITTQKPNDTAITTQKPNDTAITTQKPNDTAITTQKPNDTAITTQKPNDTAITTQKPNDTAITTKKPNDTAITTQKPNDTAITTQKPNNTAITTQKPNVTAGTTPKPTSSQKPTVMPTNKTVSTGKPSTTLTPQPTYPPRDEFVYINEIMLNKNGGFQKVELLLSKKLDVKKYTMVMVDGQTNKIMSTVSLKDMVLQKNDRLLVVTFNASETSPSMKGEGTGVAIYDTTRTSMKADWTLSESGLVDALVIGKTYTDGSEHLTDILTPGVNPFILDPNKYGISKTISRCSSDQLRSTDMFALINPSFGVDNKQKCNELSQTTSDFAIKIQNIDCKSLDETNATVSKYQLTKKRLIHYIVKKMNTACQCGVTSMHIIDPMVHCCDGVSVDMRFVAPNNDQLMELKDSYKEFLNGSNHINIKNHLYPIDNSCYENCCNVPKHPQPQPVNDTAKNVKVTVAVIVSCLLVFMIIVIVVIMYMRRKKSAVYQFRMSRLVDEEDDLDGPDQDDFVGGQEATFDINRRYQ